MATDTENQPDDHQEPKIPVFTVSKNGAILKNIFIVSKTPQPHAISDGYEQSPDQNFEETLLVGRHPDCNIMLTHPSISRFHLQIYSNRVLQKLCVVDLSSVHGTWVSGKRLEARVRVDMKEGDTLRVGASSRAYNLSWVPLTHAYDMENPFVSELDMAMAVAKQETKEEQNASFDDPNGLEMAQEIQSVDSMLEGLDILFSEGHASEIYVGEVSSAPHTHENDIALLGKENAKNNFAPQCDDQINETLRRFTGSSRFEEAKLYSHVGALNLEIEEKRFETAPAVVLPQSQYPDVFLGDSGIKMEEAEKEPYPKDEKTENSSFPVLEESKAQQNEAVLQIPEDFTSKLSRDTSFEQNSCDEGKRFNFLLSLKTANLDNRVEVDLESEMLEEPNFGREMMENSKIKDSMVLRSESFANENSSSKIEEGIPETSTNESRQSDIALQSLLDDIKRPQTWCEQHNLSFSNSKSCVGERQIIDDAVQEFGTRSIPKKDEVGLFSLPPTTESVSSSLEKTPMRTLDDKQSETLKALYNLEGQSENVILEISPTISDKKSCSLWSRRGKVTSAPHVQTCCSSKITSKGSKVSAEVEPMNKKSMVDKEISKFLFSGLDLEEEEILTPDKVNFTPKTLQLSLFQKKAKLREIKDLKPRRVLSSSESSFKACSNVEDMTTSLDKENQAPKVPREIFSAQTPSVTQIKLENEVAALKNRVERVPFQALQVNSPSNSNSVTKVKNSALKGINSSDFAQAFDKKPNSKQNRTTWDIIVDTSSLLDKESRKSLQLLQGLRGTRLIVPRTVIRALDCMNRRGSLFRKTSESTLALEWIEVCMVETNWWIRVQGSVEEGSQIAPTPPATPLSQLSDIPSLTANSETLSSCNILHELVSPTAEDYILDYTLLWRKKNNHGRTVLLSNDVILKIKAMAEGLICETAEDFRESLVNPFSDRFLWSDSCCPRGQTWSYQDDVVLKERYYQPPLKKSSSKGEAARGLKLILLHNSHYGHVSQRRA